MLDDTHESPLPQSSDDQYTFGRIGDHNVIIAHLPAGQIGNNAAAAVAGRLAATFPSLRFGLMVGIGGGVPTAEIDIRLGDVVVSQPHLQHGGVVQYDFGKTGPEGKLTRIGSLNTPPRVVLGAIAKMQANSYLDLSDVTSHLSRFDSLPRFQRISSAEDVLFDAEYNHGEGKTCKACSRDNVVNRPDRDHERVEIHYGTIASGNQVMKDGVTRDNLSAELGGVLCFEMEAAGLASTFPGVVVRGICDYSDSHKNKSWQPYASATAAAVAKEMLLQIPARAVDKTRMAAETIGRCEDFSL
jgi:nucleoside phosphorylase